MLRKRPITAFLALSLVLGSWKGYLALFEKGSPEPRQIFPCSVSSLPTADQQMLESGIPIRNAEQLRQALEDYLS